jgi:hypothetical protein
LTFTTTHTTAKTAATTREYGTAADKCLAPLIREQKDNFYVLLENNITVSIAHKVVVLQFEAPLLQIALLFEVPLHHTDHRFFAFSHLLGCHVHG